MSSDFEKKDKIISAATSLFSRFGLEKTTMEDIAKATQGEVRMEGWRAMPKDLDDQSYYDFLKEVIRVIEAERTKNGWPEIVYAPVDEPFGTKEQSIFAQEANKAIKEVGVRTYCTMKIWSTGTFSEMIDLRTYGVGFLGHGTPNYECNIPEETGRQENTRPEQEFWVYPNVLTSGSGTPAAYGRFLYGFYGFKTGIQGYNPWHHDNSKGNPFNDFDHFYNGGRFVLPGPDGPLPTLAYEGAREGIDDMRYVYTLEQAMTKAGEGEALDQAKALLEEIKKDTPGYRDWVLRYADMGRPRSAMIDDPELRKMWYPIRPPAWANEKMEEYRRRIAEASVKLNKQEVRASE